MKLGQTGQGQAPATGSSAGYRKGAMASDTNTMHHYGNGAAVPGGKAVPIKGWTPSLPHPAQPYVSPLKPTTAKKIGTVGSY